MIISKKKYEAAIARAVDEAERRVYAKMEEDRRIERIERIHEEHWSRIDRRINALADRLEHLDGKSECAANPF